MSDAPAIIWFRHDLRVGDNPALTAAMASQRPLILVYIYDDRTPGLRPLGGAQKWWLDKSLKSLTESVDALGGRLTLARGAALDVMTRLTAETGASHVYWNRRYGGPERALDSQIKASLKSAGVAVDSFNANLLMEPWTLKTGQGGHFKVFSPMWRALQAAYDESAPLPAPSALKCATNTPSEDLKSWALHPTSPDWSEGIADAWTVGENAARQRLDAFLDTAVTGYGEGRNIPGALSTSRLSPHLRFGEISPRQIWTATKLSVATGQANEKDAQKFLSEIAWREFSYHLLFHQPDLGAQNWKREFDALPWRDDPEGLKAWETGQTGYPMVDAGMRELWTTGWMHNRVRMIVASFLTKHLLIDWRRGEDWFWDTLVDADLANNAAGWQWTAGTGADAAPYFRVFNPFTQGEKFDADGAYVRQWVPELSK
ncbi:MAG: deoxyribodipyrimidine photo-lyase, partial [Pseudomonadota bacterium]